MSLDSLKTAKKRTIGTKQTLRAIEKGLARAVYVAEDAEERVVRDVLKLAEQNGLPVIRVESMALLGKTCGIKVGAASAAVLEW